MEGWLASARRADTQPFSHILMDGTQDENRTLSVASPSSSRRSVKRGLGRARAYTQTLKHPEYDNLPKPKQARNKKQRKHMARKRQLLDADCGQATPDPAQGEQRAVVINTAGIPLQYLSDSDEETTTCWVLIRRLCCCCATRAFKQRNRQREREEERLAELRLQEWRVNELQRKMEEARERENKRLRKAARKFEMRRKREEEVEKEEKLRQSEVQGRWDVSVDQPSRELTNEEIKELKRLKKLEKSLPLQNHRLAQRQAVSATWATSIDDVIVVEMEEQYLLPKQKLRLRQAEKMAEISRTREKEPMKNHFVEHLNGMHTDTENSMESEMERQHQLEMNRIEMEHRFAMEKTVQLNRHKEKMRELESQWKLQYDTKKREMVHHLERHGEMAKRGEEDWLALTDQQQTTGKQKLCSQNIQRRVEQRQVECRDVESESQTQTDRECTMKRQAKNRMQNTENEHCKQMQREEEKWQEMQEQLKAMEQRFEMEEKMAEQRYENRWKKIEEERQKEWEERMSELERMQEDEKQQQVFVELHKEQKTARNAFGRVEIQAEDEEKEIAVTEETQEGEIHQQVLLKLHQEQNTANNVSERVEKKEIAMIEDTHEETELETTKNNSNECVAETEQNMDKNVYIEVDFHDGQSTLVDNQIYMKANENQEEEKTVTVQTVQLDKGIECFQDMRQNVAKTEDIHDGAQFSDEPKERSSTLEVKLVTKEEQPIQVCDVTTVRQSKQSTRQSKPEATWAQRKTTEYVKTDGKVKRCFEEDKQQPKEASRQKDCGMEWLTEFRNKRKQERDGLQSGTEMDKGIMGRPTTRNMSRKTAADKRRETEERQTMSMDWLSDVKQEKDLHSGCQVRPVVGRRHRECELTVQKAQLEPEHIQLEDDWLGDMTVKNKEKNRAEISWRHQQRREESRKELQEQNDQVEKTDKDKGMRPRPKSRHATRKPDPEEECLLEANTQKTKQKIRQRNESMDWLCESSTKQMDSENVAATLVTRRRQTHEPTIGNTETAKHKDLDDDWLGNTSKEDKWAQIKMRHQQSREQSRQELKKHVDEAEQILKDTSVVVGTIVRNTARNMDAEHTSFAEVNKQDMEPNTSEEWWRELRHNNQRKLKGNVPKQGTEVHVSKPKEQGIQLEGHRTKPDGSLDLVGHRPTQLKKSKETLVYEGTPAPEKAALTRLDDKQSPLSEKCQKTDSWFGEWMQTKKQDKKHDTVTNEKPCTELCEERRPSREDKWKTGKTNGLRTELQDSQVTKEQMKSNGRCRLWDSLKGELHIQPCGSWKEESLLDLGDIELYSNKRVTSPLQQAVTSGHQRAAIDTIPNRFEKEKMPYDEELETITLEENRTERKSQMWWTNATSQSANTLDKNEDPRGLLNNSKDVVKENKQAEHAIGERARQNNGDVQEEDDSDDLRTMRKQKKLREVTTEGQASLLYCNNPSVAPLIYPSSNADNERKGSSEEKLKNASVVSAKERAQPEELLHNTEGTGTLEKSPSLVNLLSCYSDASDDEEDGRSETSFLSQFERPEVEGDSVNDKSVRRRVLKWINKKAKNYYNQKIDKTFKREQEEGNKLYAPWYSTTTQRRSEREQEKRMALLKAEERRQRLESSWLNWEGKRAVKKALKMEEEESFDSKTEASLWFCDDLM